MIRRPENTLAVAAFLCIVSFLLSGCDNNFSPFSVDSDQETIIVNGFLDLNADTQFVRVQLVRREIDANASADDGLTAVLLNLTTNSSEPMTDSLLVLPSGRVVHLFYSTGAIEAETPYELRVDGRDGGESRNTTNLPKRASFVTESVENLASPDPIRQPIRLRGLDQEPNNVSVTYTVLRNGTGSPIDIVFPYDDFLNLDPTGDGYSMKIRLELDRANIVAALSLPQDDATTVLQGLVLSYEMLSIEWNQNRPETDFDFFASAATFDEPWTLNTSVLSALRFAVP